MFYKNRDFIDVIFNTQLPIILLSNNDVILIINNILKIVWIIKLTSKTY